MAVVEGSLDIMSFLQRLARLSSAAIAALLIVSSLFLARDAWGELSFAQHFLKVLLSCD